ncbi:MAG: (2E,6E)-farnesyl diphosphate synthase [Thioalkalispiraceae bacterium]|jgi:geranylgeranyl pyrophosphate synthase
MSLEHDKAVFWQARVDASLDQWLPAETIEPEQLHKAMRYAVFNGGKRIRPVLTYAAGQAVNAPLDMLDHVACAVECIHAYSLIHDDLPAMDNDDLRRGMPTAHKAFDEATAILAGDALQALSFHILAHGLDQSIPADTRLEMIDLLAIASGSRGMAGGQAIDLAAVGQTINEAELENMHIHKTGALIRASVKLGALCAADVSPDKIEKLDHFAKCIGLAFQITDDILDETGDTEVLGKTQGADRALNKPTYPSILGMEASRDLARTLIDDAIHSLASFDKQADALRDIANYILERSH